MAHIKLTRRSIILAAVTIVIAALIIGSYVVYSARHDSIKKIPPVDKGTTTNSSSHKSTQTVIKPPEAMVNKPTPITKSNTVTYSSKLANISFKYTPGGISSDNLSPQSGLLELTSGQGAAQLNIKVVPEANSSIEFGFPAGGQSYTCSYQSSSDTWESSNSNNSCSLKHETISGVSFWWYEEETGYTNGNCLARYHFMTPTEDQRYMFTFTYDFNFDCKNTSFSDAQEMQVTSLDSYISRFISINTGLLYS